MNQFESQPAQADAAEGLFPGFPTLDVGKLIDLIVKRLWLAAAIAGGFVVLGLIYALTATKYYESSAKIFIESKGGDGMAQGMKGFKQKNYESLDALKSIAAGLTDGAVMLRVIDKLNLREDPTFIKTKKRDQLTDSDILEFMSKRLSSELIRGERSIYLSVEDTEPERAKKIAEALIAEFRIMLQEASLKVADNTRETLARELEIQAGRVDEAEKSLHEFREQYPDIPLDEDNGALNAKYVDLQQIANRADDEVFRLKAEYDQYLKVKDDPERILDIGTYSGKESIQKLLLARDQKTAEFFKIKNQFTPRHPTYQAFDNDVKGLNEQVREAALALGESIEKRYQSAQERAKSAREAVRLQAEFNLKAEGIRRQFRTLKRAREASLATYDRLLESINDASVTRNVDETVIHTFSPPLANHKAIKPKKAVTVILAGFLGGCVGLGTILLLGLIDRTLTSRKQVESTLGLSVLAEIPQAYDDMNWDLKETMMASKGDASLVAEGFRSLRTALSAMTPRSVMFTSSVANEGKSFCAANMAMLQAQMGYRTLLVDADIRNPQMAAIFTDPMVGGNGEGGLVSQNHCQETSVPNLYLISLGRFTVSGEPLNGEHFAAMLWEAYSSFDCVIIDSSPLTMVSDGLNYSRYADSVVLVVKSGETNAGPAQESVRELRRMRAPISGCVLNGVTKIDEAKKSYVAKSQPKVGMPMNSPKSSEASF